MSSVKLQLPKSQASLEVDLFGATVTSWKTTGGVERLFLSEKAKLDGSAAIRGGIPLVFPVFGSPKDHADAPKTIVGLPKHGFVRDNYWKVASSDEPGPNADSATVTLEFRTADKAEIASMWPFDTLLKYTLTLTPEKLTCKLEILHLEESKADQPMPFQALLHNYFLVPDATKASIAGLKDLTYIDKVANGTKFQVKSDNFTLDGEPADRVHLGEGSTRDVQLLYNAVTPQDVSSKMGQGVQLVRSVSLSETVVWNPAEVGNKGMGDLQQGGWRLYVCVEPGAVSSFRTLAKGERWVAQQTLTAW